MELHEVETHPPPLVGIVDIVILSKGPVDSHRSCVCYAQLVIIGLRVGSAESHFPTPDMICYQSIVTGGGSKLIPSFCFPK